MVHMTAQTQEKRIDKQIQLWGLLGPYLTLLNVLVSFMKATPIQTPIALIALIGIPLCWTGKLRGMAIALGTLAAVIAYNFAEMSFDQQLWMIGIGSAISLSFLVTALSLDEAGSIVDSLQVESKSRLDSMWRLDEKLKDSEQESLMQRKELSEKVTSLEEEIDNYKDRLYASERLVQLMKNDMDTMTTKQEALFEELLKTRQEAVQAREQAELAQKVQAQPAVREADSQELVEAFQMLEKMQQDEIRQKKIIQELNEHIESELREKKLLQASLARFETDYSSATTLMEENQQVVDSLTLAVAEKEQEVAVERQKYEALKVSSEEKEMVLHELLDEGKQLARLFETELEKTQVINNENIELKKTIQEMASFKDQVEVLTKELEVAQKEREQQVRHLEQELEKMQVVNNDNAELEKAAQEAALLREQVEVLTKELQTILKEREQLLKKSTKAESSKKGSDELKKVEGKLKQMTGQFEEKSKILDETRCAMFRMQEKLFALQRELDEKNKSDKLEAQQMIEKHIAIMEEDQRKLMQEHQEEVDALHELINSLGSKAT